MHNYTRKIFKSLSKKEKTEYIDKMLERGIDFSKEELTFCSKKHLLIYFTKKLATRRVFEDYEIKYLTFDQVLRHMQRNNNMIDFSLFKFLNKKQRIIAVKNIAYSNFHLNLDEFHTLRSTERKFYASARFENDYLLRTFEVKHLSFENQVKFVAVIVNNGTSLSQEMIDVLKAPAKKEYLRLVSDNLNESKIRNSISKRILNLL